MFDSAIRYDELPPKVIVERDYSVGDRIKLICFCYPNVRYNNDKKLTDVVPIGTEGEIQSIDELGLLYILWDTNIETILVVGQDQFKKV